MSFTAGWSTGDITPRVGTDMGGYWGRPGPSLGVHDPLRARVVVFAGSARLGLVSLDLVGLDRERADRLRSAIATAIQARPEAVLVCCTHTHSGPLSLSFRGMGTLAIADLDEMERTVVAAASRAAASLRACRMTVATAPLQLAVNRRAHLPGVLRDGRDPASLVVPHAHVLRLETVDRSALVVHYACHPVVLGGANRQISADYPGAAMAWLEGETGADLALFINGACGDLNPPRGDADFAAVEETGVTLGRAVVEGLARGRRIDTRPLAAVLERIELPLLAPPPAMRMATAAAVEGLKLAVKGGAGSQDLSQRRVPEARLEWALELLRRPADAPRTQSFAVQGLRLGGLRLLGMEGEMFARFQLDLEEDHPTTWLCGYGGGCVGYIPTADEYARGGYEVEEACKVYPGVLTVAPEAEGLIRATADRVLGELGR